MKKYDVVFVLLDEVLITTLSGRQWPSGIWDFRINWALWNSLKLSNPEMIVILSNQGGITKGFLKDSSFYSKISFISHALSDFTGIKRIPFRYSIRGNWKLELNIDNEADLVDSILEQYTKFSDKSKMIMIGRDLEFDKKYAESKNIEFLEKSEFVKLKNQ